VNKDIVTSLLEYLPSRYGKKAPLTVTRGKVDPYLGMTLDYSIDGMVQIYRSDFIKESWKDCHQTWMVNLPLKRQITFSQ